MSLEDAILPKQYKNARTLYEQDLDAWRQETEALLNTQNLNLQQIGRDTYGTGYEFNNNGSQTKTPTLEGYINSIISGGQPIDGTSADTFTINSDGHSIVISSAGLTASRTFTYPDAAGTLTTVAAVAAIVTPLGSIIPFYDFDGDLTFDTDNWAYCNGQTKSIGGSDRTLPDMSNRYLVGFGTETGEDMGSAVWATAAVGNASHQIDLSHDHDTNIAAFNSVGESAHTHDEGTLQFKTGYNTTTGSGSFVMYDINGAIKQVAVQQSGVSGATGTDFNVTAVTDLLVNYYTKDGAGDTGAGTSHLHSVNPPNTTSDSSLSTTQSIQPRSVRVRYIMRIL